MHNVGVEKEQAVISCPFCSEPLPEDRNPRETAELHACQRCSNPFVVKWDGSHGVAHALEHTPDIRQMTPERSMGSGIVKRIPDAMENLPVLPEVSQRVLAMVRDPDVSMADLVQVIQQDQVIAVAIMRLANSAMFGGLQAIKDLNAACSRLGMKNVANTVQVVVSNNLFVTSDKRLRRFMWRLWRHSIATAHCASRIAIMTSEPRSEAVFLAGLIHDIGKAMLLDIVTSECSGVLGERATEQTLLREVLDRFHPLLGLHIVQRWRLPHEFRAVTYAHHDPEQCPTEAWLPMTHIVALSNTVVKAEGYGVYEGEEVSLVNHPSARYLNLSDIKLAALRIDLSDKLEALFDAAGIPDE